MIYPRQINAPNKLHPEMNTSVLGQFSTRSYFYLYHFIGGNVPPHSAAVKEPEIQNGTGRVSAEHHPQLGQRVQEMARQLWTG